MHAPRRGRRAVALLSLVAFSLTSCGSDAEIAQPPWFGGYTDVMAYPEYEFSAAAAGQSHVVLGFVVADPEDPCAPHWGGEFGLGEAGRVLDLDRQVADLRRTGGEVIISFGGAAGDELASVCTDPEALYKAYRAVVDRYQVDTVDFDIEMEGLQYDSAHARRAEALAQLQRDRSNEDPLHAWLTLPVQPDGLEANARKVVEETLASEVELAGVNIMTMSFGSGGVTTASMADAAEEAARATHDQLTGIHERAGRPLSDELVWNRMGLTPMIGQNDLPEQVLDLESAAELNRFAQAREMGRVSFWSLNRDRPCAPDRPDTRRATYNCSGVDQRAGDYTRVLGEGIGD
ncbi:chitinase [Kocuria oceani]|uniref:chitinase n=1 Tax=Kocuria oceani TaxID=988827 RepID=UPI004035145F